MTFVLVSHAAATLAMTGVIWFVQVVHYPLFRFAAIGDFQGFTSSHQLRTTWVVLPLMAVELLTAGVLALASPAPSRQLAVVGLALLAVIWISTAFVQVPLHRRLGLGFDRRAAGLLVGTNWLRTVAWSARSGIALALLER